MSDKKVYHTSRTPTVMYQKCNRARYLAYHHLDTGITKDRLYIPFVVGGAVHKGLETLLSDFIGVNELPDIHSPEFHTSVKKACESARGEFLTAIEGSPYDLTALDAKLTTLPAPPVNDPFSSIPSMEGSVDPRSEYILYLTEEQCALSEMLVATYAFSEQGLRLLLREYEVLEVEQEDSFLLGETDEWQLMWESRADGLLRRRSDNSLVVLSFKTASKVDGRTTDSGESDMQGMSEVVSVEKRLQQYQSDWLAHVAGRKPISEVEYISEWFFRGHPTTVEAVQMIFLIKGSQKEDSKGRDLQENSLLRPWVRRSAFDEGDDWRFNYKWEATGPRGGKKWETLGSEYVRVNLWEEAKKLECELWELVYAFSQAKDDLTGQSPLDRWLVTPNVHRREPEVLERWLRQTRLQEMRIARGLHRLEALQNSGDKVKEANGYEARITELMDSIFPLTGSGDGKCAFWSGGFRASKCPFFDCCWGSRYYFEEPFTSGYKPREANHPGERESLKLINITKKGE